MIIDDIINKYQEIIGKFLLVKPTLLKIKQEIIRKKKYIEILPKIEKLLIDYQPLFDRMSRLLSNISKIKESKGREVNITQLVSDFINFSSQANKMIAETSDLEYVVFGTSKLRPVSIIPPYMYLLGGFLLGYIIKKSK